MANFGWAYVDCTDVGGGGGQAAGGRGHRARRDLQLGAGAGRRGGHAGRAPRHRAPGRGASLAAPAAAEHTLRSNASV